MTTLTIAAPQAIRPVPWQQLAWVGWRRYRTTLIGTLGVLGLVAAYLLLNGSQIHSDYNAWRSCTPRNSSACNFELNNFQNKYGSSGLFGFIQVLAPGLVGAFAGAPLIARELETGTHRYAWTQGIGRIRWSLAILTPGLVGTAIVTTAFGELIAWRNGPLVATGIATRMDGSLFPAVPPAAIGWGLLAFGIGVLAGLSWRRVVPALVTTIVAWFGLASLVSIGLRKHYVAPLTTTGLQINNADLTVTTWWTRAGHTTKVAVGQLNQVLQSAGIEAMNPHGHMQAQAAPGNAAVDPVQYLRQHGYTQWTSYQPASRFSTFQWIEFGWLTALAAVLLVAAVLLLRRRQA